MMATKRHLPITSSTISLLDNEVCGFDFESCDPYKFNMMERLFARTWLGINAQSTIEAVRTILHSRQRFHEKYVTQDRVCIQIYAKESKSEKRSRDLGVLLFGYPFDNLLSMVDNTDSMKLKLYLTAMKFDKVQGPAENVTLISKEMVATLNREDDLGEGVQGGSSYKYVFKDSDLGTLNEPFVKLFDGRRREWKVTLELIVDEKAAYGLKLPKFESIGKAILEGELHTDFLLVAGDGGKIPCHKVFLSNGSPVFCRMLQSDMKESTENECKLEDMSKEGVKALLKYIYYGGVEDALQDPKIALELWEAGCKYFIPGLENDMKRIFIGKPEEWFTIDAALLLFLWSSKMDNCEYLTSKTVKIINGKWNEAKETSVFQERFARIPKNFEELHSWTLHVPEY